MVQLVKLVEHGRVPLFQIKDNAAPSPTLAVVHRDFRNRCQTSTILVQRNK